jgi:mycofactocin precursor
MQEQETRSNERLDNEAREGDEETELVEELLIEEISIDGMCGVY